MITYYELRVFTPQGLPIASSIPDVLSLSISRTENAPGAFEVTVPADYEDAVFGEDHIVEIWRSIDGRSWQLIDETCWFVREIEYNLDDDGKETLTVRGHDTTGLLARHVVAWPAFGSANTGANVPSYKTAPADTAIYEIWRENFGDDTEGTLVDAFTTPSPSVTNSIVVGDQNFTPAASQRAMPLNSFSGVTVAPDGEQGPVVEADVAWVSGLEAMKRIADAAAADGVKVSFDLLYYAGDASAVGSFEFRVWLDDRGADLSDGVVLSPYWGTMKNARLHKNYSEMANWVHVGGAGQGDLRLMGGVADGTSILRSPFYPIETFVDAGEAFTDDAMIQAAKAELSNRRAKVTVGGDISQSDEFRFGREYKYGDTIAAFYRNTTVKATITQYSIEFSDGVENVSIPLEGSVDG